MAPDDDPTRTHHERGTLTHAPRDGETLSHGGVLGDAGTLTHGGPPTGVNRSTARVAADGDLSTLAPPELTPSGPAIPAPAREWQVGDLIDGRYEVRALLGRGGMGQVVRVHHREWGVDLAVKTPLSKLVGDPSARARFVREAETWVALGLHPNVVACWYVRELDGLPRLFLDHVPGGALKQALREGRILTSDLALVVDLALQVCDGLAHAHSHGVIHRDVKPANLLIAGDGRLLVTDFGLVRKLSASDGPVPEVPIAAGPGQSITGGGLGTPEYAAPEQWSAGHQADTRADVYAMGVTLFEMLAGRRPFDEPEHPEPAAVLIARHMVDPAPDVRTFAPHVPEPLARLLAACLEKAPSRRPADAAQLRRELAALYPALSDGRRARPEPRPGRLRAGALNNRAVSLWDLGRPAPARDALEEALALDPHHPEASYNRALVAWRQGESVASELARLEEARSVDRTASLRAGLLHLERMACELALERLADALELPSVAADPLAWRALGAVLVGLGRDSDAAHAYAEVVSRAPDDTRARALIAELSAVRTTTPLARPRDASALLRVPEDTDWRALAATPDGRTVILASVDPRGPSSRLHVLAAADFAPPVSAPASRVGPRPGASPQARGDEGRLVAALRTIAAGAGLATGMADAHTLYAAAGAQVRAGARGQAARIVARVLDEASHAPSRMVMEALGTVNGLAVTPDGALAATVTAEGHLELRVLRTGGCRRSFELKGKLHAAIALVPDGTRAVVVAADGSLALWDLEEADLPDVAPAALPAAGAVCVAGCPVAARVASGHTDGRVLVWELAGWRGARVSATHRTGARVESVAWSPDGRRLAAGGADGRVHLFEPGRPPVAALAHARAVTAVWFSPDGGKLVSAGADHTVQMHEVADLAQQAAAPAGAARLVRRPLEGFDAVRHITLLAGGVLLGVGGGRGLALAAGADRSLLRAPVLVSRGQAAAEQEALAVRFEDLIESARQALKRRDFPVAIAFAGAARAVQGFEHDPEALSVEARASAGQPRRRLRDAWLRGSVGWHPRPVTALAASGRTLMTAAEDAALRVWDRASEQCVLTWQPHRSTPRALALSPDALRAVSGDDEGAVWLLDLTGGEPRALGRHAGPVLAAAMLDERRAATAGADGVRVWDLAGGAPLALERPVRALCASGGRLGLSVGAELFAWDAAPGSAPRLLGKAPADIELVTASPSGALLLTASADRALALWRPGSEEPVRSFVGHLAPVRGIALTTDERFALSASADGAVIAWDLERAAPHRTLPRAGEGLNAMALTEAVLLTGGQQVREWILDWEHAV